MLVLGDSWWVLVVLDLGWGIVPFYRGGDFLTLWYAEGSFSCLLGTIAGGFTSFRSLFFVFSGLSGDGFWVLAYYVSVGTGVGLFSRVRI